MDETQAQSAAVHELELALKKAVSSPETRPLFYKTLMESSVYVVGQQEPPEGPGQEPHIHLKQWQQPDGSLALPFFATAERLRETLGPDEPCLALAARDLFRLSGSAATLVFTTAEGSKAFKPDEIAALVSMSIAQDPLALALIRATKENTEEARRNFYNVLINSQVFVVGHPLDENGQPVELEEGQSVVRRDFLPQDRFTIASCPHPHLKDKKVVPFFSSTEYLRLMARPGQKFMSFPALTFLHMAKGLGEPLVLNPGSNNFKFFTAEEVDFLLSAARQEPFEARHFKPGAKVLLGPPEQYPQELVRNLLDFLPQYPEVKAAWLACLREGDEKAPPVLVIGFQAEGELTEMFRAASELVSANAPEDMPVDFARVSVGEKGLSEYFLEKVRPFYRRSTAETPDKAATETAEPAESQASETYDKPGFFGRLKRIFGGSA